ncbi:CerR family C-terminal domain-containing protein [Pantoea sp. A4]|uniref:CerR family C-terminal domain-containing protein n=1 Tax=Pantoea sp. A4 TaxID=1225184 RepID=UPI00035C366A|nr:CerR family C-terminal domain-containing protein [Pantoea sp. A4]
MTGKKNKPLRHSQEGGYARGDETRQRIIEAAIEVFGEQGFDAATTRQIATRAGVNPPALQYYFNNKEGVYSACARYLAEANRPAFQPVLDAIEQLPADAPTPQCVTLFCDLVDTLLDKVFGNDYTLNKRLFHARIQLGQGPETAFQIMRECMGREIHRAGADLISRLSGEAIDSELTQLRTVALFGQAITFHIARRSVLDQLQWKEVDGKRLAQLKKLIRDNNTVMLNSWHNERP